MKKLPRLTPAEKALVDDLVRDGLSIQKKFRPDPLYKKSSKGHYASDNIKRIRRAERAKPKGGKV
jgi:hypothetical protein